jgi:thiazole synthase
MDVFRIKDFEITNRLFVGTGKYPTYELMQKSLEASGCQVVTVAVRRERLVDAQGRSLLDFLDLSKYVILPNKGAGWVKLEVLGDKKTLMPDPVGTIEATRELAKEGFTVLAYSSDDPRAAVRIKEAGAASVMPAGSPIGSGQGVLNPLNISLCLELLKENDRDYPVIVDAGVGTASDVTIAMELGADGVLLNTGIAHAKDPVQMADAMRHALEAGRLAYQSGRIPKKRYATASSPFEGVISYIPGE